jgi:predicted Zn-dependent peptidase
MDIKKSSFQYLQLAPNFRLIANPLDRFEVKFNMYFSAGGAYFEEDGAKGCTHLLEHCMLSRTKKLDEKQLKNFLFESDIYTNAFTGRLGMDFLVSGHKSDSEKMFELMLEFGFDPTLTNEVLNQEKEVILREISQYSGQTNYRLNRTLIEAMFEPGSYSYCEVLGKSADVKNSTIGTLKNIQKRMYDKSNFIVTVSGGGIDVDKVVKKLEPLVAKLSNPDALPINFQPPNKLKNFKYLPVVSDLGHEHAVLKVIIPCPVTLENRPVRSYIKELIFEYPVGVLYSKLRDELGLIYGLNYAFDMASNTLAIEMTCEIEHITKIISEIKSAFSNFENIFTDHKTKIIKELIIKRRELSEDDPQFAIDFLVNMLGDFGVIVNYEDYIKQIASVSIEDIKVLYDLIHENLSKMQIVVVSNKKEIKDIVIR